MRDAAAATTPRARAIRHAVFRDELARRAAQFDRVELRNLGAALYYAPDHDAMVAALLDRLAPLHMEREAADA